MSHEPQGADHVPHVTPLLHYFAVFGALLVFTVITVGVSYVDLGPWNLVVAMLVATTKAILVAAIFMHLLYDHKFHTVVFSMSLLFLAIFIAFTSFDTFARGRAELIEGLRPAKSDDPWNTQLRAKPMTQVHDKAFEAAEHAGEAGGHHGAEGGEHKAAEHK